MSIESKETELLPGLYVTTVSDGEFPLSHMLSLNINLEKLCDCEPEDIWEFRQAALEMVRLAGLLQALHANRLTIGMMSCDPNASEDKTSEWQKPYENENDDINGQLPRCLKW